MSFPFSRTVGAGTHNVSLSDINILCDTSGGAVNLVLPKISEIISYGAVQGYGIGSLVLFTLNITDISNNASTNNITINTVSGDSFSNNLSFVAIKSNNGSVSLKPTSELLWNVVFTTQNLSTGNLAVNENLAVESSLIREYYQGSFVNYPLNVFSSDKETIVGYIKVTANTYKIGDIYEGKAGLLSVRYGMVGSGTLNFYVNENLAFSKETLVNSFSIVETNSSSISGIANYNSSFIKILSKNEIVGTTLNLKSNPIQYDLLPTRFFDITKDVYFIVTAQLKDKNEQFALLDITLNKIRNAELTQ